MCAAGDAFLFQRLTDILASEPRLIQLSSFGKLSQIWGVKNSFLDKDVNEFRLLPAKRVIIFWKLLFLVSYKNPCRKHIQRLGSNTL